MTITAGERFARAIAARDAAALRALLADPVSFTALTPGGPWQADSASEVIDEIILGRWFARVLVMELQSVGTGQVADCQQVGYRLGVRTADGDFLVEQQACYGTEDKRIAWMRILCSGYQPTGEKTPFFRGDTFQYVEGTRESCDIKRTPRSTSAAAGPRGQSGAAVVAGIEVLEADRLEAGRVGAGHRGGRFRAGPPDDIA